jgi:hypothetical protein
MAGFHVGDTCIKELWVESFVLVVTWLKDVLKTLSVNLSWEASARAGGELS